LSHGRARWAADIEASAAGGSVIRDADTGVMLAAPAAATDGGGAVVVGLLCVPPNMASALDRSKTWVTCSASASNS
jgi:hypothetical protein